MGSSSSRSSAEPKLIGVGSKKGSCRSLIDIDQVKRRRSVPFFASLSCARVSTEVAVPPVSLDEHTAAAQIAAAVSGQRKDQDRFVMSPRLDCGVCFGAIFDGHGPLGHGAAEATAAELPRLFNELVLKELPEGVQDPNLDPETVTSTLRKALKDSFAALQQKMDASYEENVLEPARKLQRKIEAESGVRLGKQAMPQDSGTTASVVILYGNRALLGWVGDSRAVLVSSVGGSAKGSSQLAKKPTHSRALSVDHNISAGDRDELQRVTQAGGTVLGRHFAINGADGMFQLTRSIGDVPFHRSGAVLCAPGMADVTIEPSDACIVIASDGLWDHYTNDEAGALIMKQLEEANYRSVCAQNIASADDVLLSVAENCTSCVAERGTQNGKKCDDISILLVAFDAFWR